MSSKPSVKAWREEVILPTYEPFPPDPNPMFLEKRVYQGSNGKVYPLPFTDRISISKVDRRWKAIYLENDYLQVMILPEIGGRIHAVVDKTNGYDVIYRQTVIKPALVGLAGPWISGGIEFNWPQHHRPSTFMPAGAEIEEWEDGSVTVWLSEHDPMARMKGMHGVSLRPGKAYVELKVRAYNRTPFVQSFLWWANVATRVHEAYQSFFPPDVWYVADHAKRAVSEYPLCQGHYYGVDYGKRGRGGVPELEHPTQFVPAHCRPHSQILPGNVLRYAPNDLSWYANIPVPTSYMCMGSKEDFFGGYDHARQAGLIHIANHHISPGKKQWTWGNHDFGYAWDRNLTDTDGPYIELMAGVYTDNQPDFSFLKPGETKTWTQYWYPIQKIGPTQHANLDAALSLHLDRKEMRIGVSVSSVFPRAVVRLERSGSALEWDADLEPGKPFVFVSKQAKRVWKLEGTTLRVLDQSGREVIAWTGCAAAKGTVPPPATEPAAPADMVSADELYVTGLHLEQYRHATRCPTAYWREALRRDPGDARCNNAMGLWHLRRGEFGEAEGHFRLAIERLTRRNPNPRDCEPYYNLGLCLRFQMEVLAAGVPAKAAATPRNGSQLFEEAYAAFYKAVWDHAWQASGYHALAEMDCQRRDWPRALQHLDQSLRLNTDNLKARDLRVMVLRRLGRGDEAADALKATLALDPLDWWARYLRDGAVACDTQTLLDLVLDLSRAGLIPEALRLLERATPEPGSGTLPLTHYYRAHLLRVQGKTIRVHQEAAKAAKALPDYCFPARLEEGYLLGAAIAANPRDARGHYYLANWLYDRRRHQEAVREWEISVSFDPQYSVAWRNLGIGYFNIRNQPRKACQAYDRAVKVNPDDARLLYERDQLWKRLGVNPKRRLKTLEDCGPEVSKRDDLTLEFCSLLNQTGQPGRALELLESRQFQPWEGGEGMALGQFARAQLLLGRARLTQGDATGARKCFEAALTPPLNLGETRHLLANASDIHYWLGEACFAEKDTVSARKWWTTAASFRGDFQDMTVRSFSEMTYFTAMAQIRLGKAAAARGLFKSLLHHGQALERLPAKIDYFATSLPTMLLFEDDLQTRQETRALFLQAQAYRGLGQPKRAASLLRKVLKRDPNHALAADLAKEMGLDP